jgi:VanZ family protein
VLLTATTLPAASVPSVGTGDKVNHFLAYMGYAILFNLTLLFQTKSFFLKKYSSAATIIFGSIYGLIDELHQMFIPGRSAEFMDWVADFCGLLFGISVVILLKKLSDYSFVENNP